jgi:hypothetical protein
MLQYERDSRMEELVLKSYLNMKERDEERGRFMIGGINKRDFKAIRKREEEDIKVHKEQRKGRKKH